MQETNKFSLSSDGSLGIFTTVALILLLWGLFWLKGYAPFSSQQHINVMFAQVAGLLADAPVFVDGVKAGAVEKVTWKNNNQVLVRLRITHPQMIIPQGAQFNILTNGIIGARYIDIVMPNTDKSLQQPIDESTIVMGEETRSPDVIVGKIDRDLDKIDIDKIKENLTEDRQVLRLAGNQFSRLATKAMPVVDRALPLEDNLIRLSADMRKTLNRLNKFSDNPKLSSDLREIVNKASETAQTAQAAIRELNDMVADKSLRKDIGETMSQVNQSMAQFERSMEMVQQVSKDKDLRLDIKQILLEARKAMDKLDEILGNPESGADIRSTLKRTRATLTDIDLAARQLQQILDKRHPLIHMFIGRPGHIEAKDSDTESKSP